MSGPLLLKVTEAVGPLGTTAIVKQALDVREVIVDFTRWLNAGEALAALSFFTIQANPPVGYPSWQTDFPFTQSIVAAPSDTNPLVLAGATIISTTQAQLLIGAGTPGLGYMLSFLATAGPTQGQKEIDILVSINLPVNSAMITSISPPGNTVVVVSGTTALSTGTTGSVNISNVAGAAITVTLPGLPVLDQTINAKDVLGNAGTFHITFQGASGAPIDGSTTFLLTQNYQAASFKWTGTQWSVL